MKIPPVEAEFLYTDGQTGMTKLIVTLREFTNAPKSRIRKKKLSSEWSCKTSCNTTYNLGAFRIILRPTWYNSAAPEGS